jgi:hypothetical protein
MLLQDRKDHMIFNAPRCDNDIRKSIKSDLSFLDPTPPLLEARLAWNMRPRNKSKEIGP